MAFKIKIDFQAQSFIIKRCVRNSHAADAIFMNEAGDSSLGPIVGVLQIEQRCPARPARAVFVVPEKLSRFELTIQPL